MHLCTVLDIQYTPVRIFIKQKTKNIYIFFFFLNTNPAQSGEVNWELESEPNLKNK